MGDTKEIKAKITVEYDGSGVAKAKEDLASLADIAGGQVAEGTSTATENLASLDEQMGKVAGSTQAFTSSVGDMERPLATGSSAITSVTEALGEHQTAIAETGSAYEALQKPVEGMTAFLEEASPPMLEITKSAQSMQSQLSTVGDGFTQVQEVLSQSVPLLPQFADGLHTVSEQFDPKAFGLDTFNENMSVFQDALVNPAPFSMIQQHLVETGQTWGDFTSAIGNNNTAFLTEMATNADVSHKVLGGMSTDVQGIGQTFSDAASGTDAFSQQWNSMYESIADINKNGGVGAMLYGPQESFGYLDEVTRAMNGVNELGGVGSALYGPQDLSLYQRGFNQNGGVGSATYGPEDLSLYQRGLNQFGGVGSALYGPEESPGLFGDISELFGGAGLNSLMMPLMGAQMAFQMVSQGASAFAQGIYNMAVIAEGPAAHSIGTFTGSVDALGQTAKAAGGQFSESFGQGMLPTINATNTAIKLNAGGLDGIGKALGTITGGAIDIGEIFTGAFTNNLPLSVAGVMGLINIGNGSAFPGAPPSSQVQVNLPQIQQQLAQSAAVMQAQANNPAYLAAQTYLQTQTGYAEMGQTSYNDSHMVGSTPYDYSPQAYQNRVLSQLNSGQMSLDQTGWSDVDKNKYFFNSQSGLDDNTLRQMQWAAEQNPSSGCFPSGTRILMNDDSERAIETLQVGEQVLAHDDERQVVTTILALIKPPPKRVYELSFADGSTLTLTDSHPVKTTEGWKSILPRETKRENPDLPVTTLKIRDLIIAVEGTRKLIAIRQRSIVQVHNITVDDPHVFYANGVLVHNKMMNQSIDFSSMSTPQTQGSIQLPHIDLSGIGASLAGAFSGIQLPHLDLGGITSNLAGAFSGISLPHIDLSGMATSLASSFTGIPLPHIDLSGIGASLAGAFSGISMPHLDLSGIMSGLSGAFSGISLPHIDLSGLTGSLASSLTGIQIPHIDLSGITSSLSGAFSGIQLPSLNLGGLASSLASSLTGIQIPNIPDIGGMINGALGGMFSGIQMPRIPDVGGMISGALGTMFSGIQMPRLPDLGGMISGALGSMLSGISIPLFASGVENYSGGAAVVGEGSTPEIVAYNGQYSLFNRATFVNLPSGASVYPMQNMANYAFSNPSVLGGGGGSFSPISLGGGGGSGGGPQAINVHVDIAGQSIISAIGLPLAETVRVSSGLRAF